MLVIALILFVGPLIGGALSLGAGAQLWRDGKAEGPIAVLLTTALGLLAIWGLRYELGLNLPELSAGQHSAKAAGWRSSPVCFGELLSPQESSSQAWTSATNPEDRSLAGF